MGKLALVTGSSAGIGLHIAKQLAKRGYDIVGVGASDRVYGMAEQLPSVTVHPVKVDLASESGVSELWAQVEKLEQPLDVAALNAGKSLGGSFVDTSIDDEMHMLALNVTCQVLLAKKIVAAMTIRRKGRILITSSLSATTPTPYESIYGPTRAFMYSFAEGLREELREYGVTVTALLPGATATDFHATAGMGSTKFGSNDWKNDPEVVARKGVEALFADKDHVVGGDLKTRWSAIRQKFLPEQVKARQFARASRPT